MMEPDTYSAAPSYGGTGSPEDATYAPSSSYNSDQLERAKQQVEDVKGIMGQNVNRIIARGETLEDLDARANNLTANASEFQRTSRNLQRKMWWKNIKMMLILGLVITVVIVIIIVAAVGVPSSGGGGTTPTTTLAPLKNDGQLNASIANNSVKALFNGTADGKP